MGKCCRTTNTFQGLRRPYLGFFFLSIHKNIKIQWLWPTFISAPRHQPSSQQQRKKKKTNQKWKRKNILQPFLLCQEATFHTSTSCLRKIKVFVVQQKNKCWPWLLRPVPHGTLRPGKGSFPELFAEIRADTSTRHNCNYNAFHLGISKQFVDIK